MLHCPNGPPELRENYDFPRNGLNDIASALAENLTALCEDWKKIHGNF